MERLIARLAVLLISATLHATPTPEHRERLNQDFVMYKWIVQDEWRWDELSQHWFIYKSPFLVEDYRTQSKPNGKAIGDGWQAIHDGWHSMPKGGELPRGKEGER